MSGRRKYLPWTIAAVVVIFAAATAYVLAPADLFAPKGKPPGFGTDRSADVIRDCDTCPDMLPVPAGEFLMGDPPGRRERLLNWIEKKPPSQRRITIAKPFAIGRYQVTFDQWDACVADGGCGGHIPGDEGWGRGTLPVMHVSWNDAHAYTRWLSQKTGARYRLPTDAEWEYAARAGSTTTYSWGAEPSHDYANFGENECCVGRVEGADTWVNTSPVGSFPPNAFGLHDVSGNVYEWVEDCYDAPESDRPTDGSAAVMAGCENHAMRGAAWYSDPWRIRSAYRAWQTPDTRDRVIGFRVLRELD